MTVQAPEPEVKEVRKAKSETVENISEREVFAYLTSSLKDLGPKNALIVPKTIVPGINYRVNFYCEKKDESSVIRSNEIVKSVFVKIIKTAVGLDFVNETK
jgi:hypothetical protein